MPAVSIDHPTGRPNFTIVTLGETSLAFSYRTIVGVQSPETDYHWRVTVNYWGPTTGRHLNYLSDNHAERLPAAEFAALVERVTP